MSPVETASPRGFRRDLLAIAAIAAVAAVARVLVMQATPASAPISDMAEYWTRGVYLYEHGTLYPDSWRMPGLPAWLALVFTLGGGVAVDLARLGNVAAGAVTTALTYWLARRGGLRRHAVVAATIVALYPTLLLYTSLVATEAVVAVPLLGALIAATYTTPRAAVALGLCTAAALLVRPAAVALVPAALVALWWDRRGTRDARADERGVEAYGLEPAPTSRGSRIALFLAALLLALLPWWMHNASLHGRFVPLDTTGGLNLLIGSGPGANGRWDYTRVVELQNTSLLGVDVTTPAGSDRASALAWAHMRAHPLTWLALVPAKVTGLFAFEGRETAYLYSVGFFGAQGSTTAASWTIASVAAFPLLFVACAWQLARGGLRSSGARLIAMFLGASVALHLATFGDPRFHLPFVPLMAVMAATPRVGGVDARWRWVAIAVCALMAVAWYAQLDYSMPIIRLLIAPGGWQRPVSFDDLL